MRHREAEAVKVERLIFNFEAFARCRDNKMCDEYIRRFDVDEIIWEEGARGTRVKGIRDRNEEAASSKGDMADIQIFLPLVPPLSMSSTVVCHSRHAAII